MSQQVLTTPSLPAASTRVELEVLSLAARDLSATGAGPGRSGRGSARRTTLGIRTETAPAREGSALALALLVVVLVAGMGFAFLTLAASVTKRQTADVETVQAFYLAEAGLAEAFHAVRAGRSGQIATIEEPATFGGGLLWVEAVENEEGHVELDAQALFGRARSALRMTVEPVPLELGFFADQDLIIDSVLMVDGFDSGAAESPAGPETGLIGVPPIPAPPDYDPDDADDMRDYYIPFFSRVGMDRLLSADSSIKFSEDPDGPYYTLFEWEDDGGSMSTKMLTSAVAQLLGGDLDYMRYAYESSYLRSYFDGRTYELESGAPARPHTVSSSLLSTRAGQAPSGAAAAGELPGSGLLGSNGDVEFVLAPDEPVTIDGDVIPGAGGAVLRQSGTVAISGSTAARPVPVELPEVEVPAVPLQPAVDHDSLLPMTVPPGTVGFEALRVAADAELVVRGPATVVVGQLELAAGALLTLDTRNGPVDLYVTEHLHLDAGSDLSTTAAKSSDSTIQVSAVQVDSDPLVRLESTAQFTGTVYSPRADVRVGAAFEVWGGIVGRKLELAPGARLHADRASDDRSPLPQLISWKLLVVPMAPNFAHRDPFTLYGTSREAAPALSEAHDLASVRIDLDYLNAAGDQQTYTGPESGLDWTTVDEVVLAYRTVDYDATSQAANDARENMGADLRREEPATLDPADDLNAPSDLDPTIRRGVELIGSESSGLSKGQMKQKLDADYFPITSGEARWLNSLNIGFNANELDRLMGL